MRKFLYRTAAACIVAAVLCSMPAKAVPTVSARSAVLMDAKSGRVLWEKNANARSLIASTTKIMTGLLIAEDCTLDESVLISDQAAGIEGSSLCLNAGEQISVEELLYGMMLHSGNDAAAALAIHHSGSFSKFADRMNEKAARLDLKDTHFVNPHGLDEDEHYSTAMDLARLTMAAMENPVFYKVVSTKSIDFSNRHFTNHNKLLWQYDGVVGVKTGYTKAAGRILVSCAERDGRRLIAVTIHAPDDWKDHKAMLDFGFSAYSQKVLVEKNQTIGITSVIGGVKSTVEACAHDSFLYPVMEKECLRVEVQLPEFVYAPVWNGEQAGSLIVFLNDKEIGCVPLFWRETIWEVP